MNNSAASVMFYCFIYQILLLLLIEQVMKKEVDSYEKGKRVPVCQLQAIHQVDQISDLLFSVKLEGTKDRTYVQLFRATTGKAYFT